MCFGKIRLLGGEHAVKVMVRDDAPNSAYTWPVMEGTFVLSDSPPPAKPAAGDQKGWASSERNPLIPRGHPAASPTPPPARSAGGHGKDLRPATPHERTA